MSTLLDQFVTEGGELLDDATSGLLKLERDPNDAELLNGVFRAAHTFKGSSGLFEQHVELTRVVHAAEDVLDALRRRELELDAELIDDIMAALDLARDWLGAIEASGTLPEAAAHVGSVCISRLRSRLTSKDEETPTPLPREARPPPPWALAAADATPAVAEAQEAGTTVRAIRYDPPPDCFFRGEDPLGLVAQIPGLLDLVVLRDEPWPPIGELDEYACAVRFELLTSAPTAVLDDLLRYVQDEVEIFELSVDTVAVAATSEVALMLLAAQRGALSAPCPPEDEVTRLRGIADTVLRALAIDGRRPETLFAGADALLLSPDRAGLGELLDALAGDEGASLPVAPGPPSHPDSVPDPEPDHPVGEPRRAAVGRTMKVEQYKIDHLLDLVGELIVSKNALPFLARSAERGEEARVLARSIKDQHVALNRLTEELQAAAMDMRMLPASVVFDRFPRLVRDTARKLGKQVRLETFGGDTSADKDMLEQLADPLLHMMRNSLDHGLESAEERQAAGKSPEGTITLTAAQQPDGVMIELSDDGRGVDPAAIRRSAYAKGLISEQEAESLDDAASRELLFRAGFSTAETVSDLSGRGVGMDAVRSTIVGLGGTVSLESAHGAGTTVRLRLPLSMAVTKVMVFTVAGQQFGVPVDVVRETVRLPRSQIQRIADQPAIVRRGAVVPVFDLAGALELRAAPPADEVGEDDDVRLLVLDIDGAEVAIGVQRFEEHLDIMLKPLEGVLAGLPGLAGSTLLGDGTVLLILDLAEVLRNAGSAR
jgi:two-component system chemotaxis sensor kinase CheA